MNVGIIHIGDELLTGMLNPYSECIIKEIKSKNADIKFIHIITDDTSAIIDSISYAQNTADLLIITGGLGPTLDDLTREAVAEYLHTDLEIDSKSLSDLEKFMKQKSGKELDEASKRMARIPHGTEPLHNPCGAACGIKAESENMTIYCLPGFPNEFMAMFHKHILPAITGSDETTEELTIFISESEADPYLRQIAEKYNVRVASLPTLEWRTKGNKVVIKGNKEDAVSARRDLENLISSR